MKKLVVASSLLIATTVNAVTPSMSMAKFCLNRRNPDYVKSLTQSFWNLMGFYNQGGIINKGVCWWHSRFQRNALYLTIYKPDLPKPTKEEAKIIIKKIKDANEIVIIPGYDDFFDFSRDYVSEILSTLEGWQRRDAVRFAWIDGLSGKVKVSADKLKSIMDQTYEEVEVRGNIAYQKLQIRGIDSHAWLVIHMTRTEKGYDLEILDSNDPIQTEMYHYTEGMTHFENEYYGDFTPYLENTDEMNRINQIIQNQCS